MKSDVQELTLIALMSQEDEQGVRTLNEMQLVLVAGGVGEVVIA